MRYITKKDNTRSLPPKWDLSNLFSGTAQELQDGIASIDNSALLFQQKYHDKPLPTGVVGLLKIIKEYQQIVIDSSQIMLFVQLRYCEDLGDNDATQLYQKTAEQMSQIAQKLVFFDKQIASLPTTFVDANQKELGVYSRWLRLKQKFLPHYLDTATEQVLIQKDLVAEHAWINLYDKIFSNLEIKFEGQTLNYEMARNKLLSTNRATRQKVAKLISRKLQSHSLVLTEIMDSVLLNKNIEDQCRKYAHPLSQQNMSNDIQDQDLENLVQAVQKNYKIAHRYYALKAKLLGLKKLQYYDVNAPLHLKQEFIIPWDKGREMVLEAYSNFSPKFAEIVQDFLRNHWIDAQLAPRKASGAFCCHGTPATNPYILMSYQNRVRDVMTLAHELGHGVHFVLANAQPYLLQSTPLTISETASVFGEMLTFQHLLDTLTSVELQRYLLASKIEEKISTVMRQIAFHSFELILHTRRKQGRLSYEEMCQIWRQTQQESLGPAVDLPNDYLPYWTGILHFIHFPFYVYAYAFGDCLVNNLYNHYQACSSDQKKRAEFVNNYTCMLESGNSKNYRELLQMFNLNPSEKKFWQNGIDFISGLVDKLEKII